MSATGISLHNSNQNDGPVSILPGYSGAIEPLVSLAILQANAQAAYVYHLHRQSGSVSLAAYAGPPPYPAGAAVAHPLRREVAVWHCSRTSPLLLETRASTDWRFAGFPEFHAGRFEGLFSLPLLDAGEVVGLANLCRTAALPLNARALALVMNLSLPLGALLVASGLRQELQKANRDLADRKLIERAKGLLQARFQWTEEEAYLRIRRASRRSRTPMRDIARLVIESGARPIAEAL